MQGHIEQTEDGQWRAVAGKRARVFRLHRGARNWLVRRGAELPRGSLLAPEDAELAVTMAVRAWGSSTNLKCVERMAKALAMDHRAIVPTMRRHGITISAERRRQKKEQSHE